MFRLFGFLLLIISTLSVNASEFQDALKAAEQGYAKAQLNLGFMYYSGEGVLQNDKKACMWVNLALHNGYDAPKAMGIITKDMASNNINEAKTMSEICFKSNYKKCN